MWKFRKFWHRYYIICKNGIHTFSGREEIIIIINIIYYYYISVFLFLEGASEYWEKWQAQYLTVIHKIEHPSCTSQLIKFQKRSIHQFQDQKREMNLKAKYWAVTFPSTQCWGKKVQYILVFPQDCPCCNSRKYQGVKFDWIHVSGHDHSHCHIPGVVGTMLVELYPDGHQENGAVLNL